MIHKKIFFGAFVFTFFFAPIFALAYTIDSSGGDCSTFGTWDGSTCTLTRDINEKVEIVSSDITLDGAGYSINEHPTEHEVGFVINSVSNVTVKNLSVRAYQGIITVSDSKNITLQNLYIQTYTSISRTVGIVIEGTTFDLGKNGAYLFVYNSTGRFSGNTHIGQLVSLNNSSVVFSDNIIRDMSWGVGASDVTNSTFSHNIIIRGKYGIVMTRGNGNVFTENTISDMTGKGISFNKNLVSDNAVIYRNNFINNELDISVANSYGVSMNESLSGVGNYWSKNVSCEDKNGDNICDSAYLFSSFPHNPYIDNFPWVKENGWNAPPPSTITLTNSTETEDDGIIDGKGAADKTKFMFSVTATGESEVMLFVDGTATILARSDLGEYAMTSTFPKGKHNWYFEANKNGLATTTTEVKSFMAGYSNVVFLPGLEASRLYVQGTLFENQLWEPNWNADVQKLYLNPNGTSIRTDIYTRDIIDQANIIPDWSGLLQGNIYKSFIESMKSLVSAGTIKEWEPLPYDWRYDINDVVNNPIKTADSTYSMLGEIERLAESSDTGKVIIIGHSNGGLVGKALINKLAEIEKPNITEKFIMVAVPQLGTPQAISSLLHGDSLPDDMFPILMDQPTARTLGENMSSGYNLLPSPEYFNRVLDPVATFDELSSFTQKYVQRYGTIISNPTELHDFLLGAEGRTKPTMGDRYTPNILNSNLLTQSEQNHAWLDTWAPPEGVEVIQIAGWGIDTISGINYKTAPTCEAGCRVLDHEPIMTSDGDGTVVIPSATASTTAKTYYVDLGKYNVELWLGARHNREHKDILEVEGLRNQIKNIIQNISKIEDNISLAKPPTDDATKKLRLKIHSPVSLNLYDSFGNHTGIVSSPIGDMRYVEEQIPNSYYLEMGEGKYAGVQENGATTIKLVGESSGTFTLDIEEIQGNSTVKTTTFADIPVMENSIATVQTTGLATVPTLNLDIDGDGTTDATIDSGTGISTDDLIGILKGTIKTLGLPKKKQQDLLQKIDKLEKALDKEYKSEKKQKRKTKEIFKDVIQKIKQLEKKKLLTTDESTQLQDILGQIQKSVVK